MVYMCHSGVHRRTAHPVPITCITCLCSCRCSQDASAQCVQWEDSGEVRTPEGDPGHRPPTHSPAMHVGAVLGVLWQQGCPGPPHSTQLPFPVLLLHTRRSLENPALQKSLFPSPAQQRSPSSPQGRHVPVEQTLPFEQNGSNCGSLWQQGSPVPPQGSQVPPPETLVHRRLKPFDEKPVKQRSPSLSPAQQRSPSSPQGRHMPVEQTLPFAQNGSNCGSLWQQGSPVPPQASQVPPPETLVHRRLKLSDEKPVKQRSPSLSPAQQGSPRSPHGRHRPDAHTLPLAQLGSSVGSLWQQGSPASPQEMHTPRSTLQIRFPKLLVGRAAKQRRELSFPGQHG